MTNEIGEVPEKQKIKRDEIKQLLKMYQVTLLILGYKFQKKLGPQLKDLAYVYGEGAVLFDPDVP